MPHWRLPESTGAKKLLEESQIEKIANAQRIRNNSDYDDFYIADKAECEQQVKAAGEFYNKAFEYFEKTRMGN